MIISEVERKFSIEPRIFPKVKDLLLEDSPFGLNALEPEYQELVDVYFDFDDRRLTSEGHYLRIRSREVGDTVRRFMTLRFLSKMQGTELIDEETRPLSDEGIREILLLLHSRYKDFPLSLNSPFITEIHENAGIHEILRILNHRIVRDVFSPNDTGVRAFRVKLDEFTYAKNIHESSDSAKYQLEIDFYHDKHILGVKHFLSQLESLIGRSLQEIAFSKVSQGLSRS